MSYSSYSSLFNNVNNTEMLSQYRSDYRMDDRGLIPSRSEGFFSSSLCVQTGSEAHPASYPAGTEVLSPGVKHGHGVMLNTSPPSNAEVKNESEIYLLSPQVPPYHVVGWLYLQY
jgi:hypothetical protein